MKDLVAYITEANEERVICRNLNESLESILEKLITVGGRAYPNFGHVVVMAGGAGCYPKGTEYLTPEGWKQIEEYSKGDQILQYDRTTGESFFAQPEQYVELPTDQFYRIKNRRVDFTTSESHKHLVVKNKYRNPRTETATTLELFTQHNATARGNRAEMVNTFNYNGNGLDMTNNQIRLMVAIIADGHYLPRASQPKVRFSFNKGRKIDRVKVLLKLNQIEYKEYEENDFTRFEFNYDVEEKEFGSQWYGASFDQLNVICDEVLKWDGSIVERDGRNNMESFCSTSKKSADFIQFAFTAIGVSNLMTIDAREGRVDCYCINIAKSNSGISKNNRSDEDNTTTIEKVDQGDTMYCFTTQTGFFVVRQNGRIYVSGNSGKGFVQSTLLGVEGKTFDVDELKKLAMNNAKVVANIKRDHGIDISKFDLRNPADVSALHDIIGRKMNLPRTQIDSFLSTAGVADPDRKPNMIFDVTMKGIDKLQNISRDAIGAGYDPKNIHVVWVINDIEIAQKQNAGRPRVVPADILMSTHKGAAMTMGDVLDGSIDLSKVMDGDIWLVFNQENVDSTTTDSPLGVTAPNSQTPNKKPSKFANFTIDTANIILVKKTGQKIDKDKITDVVIRQITDYVPKGSFGYKK